MLARTLVIRNPNGIHARPAQLFVQAATAQPAAVRLRKGERTVSGRSVLDVLTLGMKCGDTITLEIDANDPALLATLADLLTNPMEHAPGASTARSSIASSGTDRQS